MLDCRRKSRALINQAGVYFDQARAGRQMALGVVGADYSAHTDNRELAFGLAVNLADHEARARL